MKDNGWGDVKQSTQEAKKEGSYQSKAYDPYQDPPIQKSTSHKVGKKEDDFDTKSQPKNFFEMKNDSKSGSVANPNANGEDPFGEDWGKMDIKEEEEPAFDHEFEKKENTGGDPFEFDFEGDSKPKQESLIEALGEETK